MNSHQETEVNAYDNALADLYINHDAERQLSPCGGYEHYRNVQGGYVNNRGHNAIGTGYRDITGSYTFVIDSTLSNERYHAMRAKADRHYWWKLEYDQRKDKARRSMEAKLRDTTPYRCYASPTVASYTYHQREGLRQRIHTTIKKYGDPRRLEPGSVQHTNALAMLISAATSIGEGLPRNLRTPNAEWMIVNEALAQQSYKIGGAWMAPVWKREPWFRDSPFFYLHQVHVSEKHPELIAYTQSGEKLLKDVQTATRPGKYLMQFFGPGSENPVLSEAEVREWANKQAAVNKTDDLHFISNTDPDGWVWVYENGSGFNSCMVYNHPSNRYIDHELHGDKHPVRIYANKHNDLALAYIGDEPKKDSGRVYGRAIVNQATKEWVRLYGDDRLKHALQKHGYTANSGCMNGQVLTCKEHRGAYIMPYLDGEYTNVTMDIRDREDVFVIDEDGRYDAQNSSGLMGETDDDYVCPCCGSHFDDEDELYYVEDRGESICESCRYDRYRYAYGRRGQDYYPVEDCIECESDGEWYLERYASDHDVYQCVQSELWYHIDDLVMLTAGEQDGEYVHTDYAKELSDGNWCLEEEYDDLQAELDAENEEDEGEETDTPATQVLPRQRQRTQPVERITRRTFQPGDKVMIVRSQESYTNGWSNTWVDSMYERVNDGVVYTVTRVEVSGVYFEEISLGWPWKSLMFAEDANTTMTQPNIVPGYVTDVSIAA